MTHTVTISEEDRQVLLLALALVAHERTGWEWLAGEIAEKLSGRDMFAQFLRLRRLKSS